MLAIYKSCTKQSEMGISRGYTNETFSRADDEPHEARLNSSIAAGLFPPPPPPYVLVNIAQNTNVNNSEVDNNQLKPDSILPASTEGDVALMPNISFVNTNTPK